MIDATDLDINRAVRRVLVKHWIDLGRVSVRSTRGRVLMRGLLRRIEGASAAELTPPIVEAMFCEIGRIRGVQHVAAHLDNWINDSGHWRPFQRATADRDEQLGHGGGSFDV